MRSDKNDCENDTCVSKYCKKFVLAVKETPCGMLWDTVILLYFKSSWKYKFWLKIYSLMIIKSDSWNLPINVKTYYITFEESHPRCINWITNYQICIYIYIYIYIHTYTVERQLCYIIRCYTTYQLHVSATLLGQHQGCT